MNRNLGIPAWGAQRDTTRDGWHDSVGHGTVGELAEILLARRLVLRFSYAA